jgi:hypothetical protein
MKTKIDNYGFNSVTRTITFLDYTNIRIDGVLGIINVTTNVEIFNFLDPSKGGTTLNNVLTLDYDTSLMNDVDKLLIYYDDSKKVSTDANIQLQQSIEDADVFKDFVTNLKREESGELNVIDENLRRVLGTVPLVTQSSKLNINPIPDYYITSKTLTLVTNASFMSDVSGYSSLAIQISGTWTGTITFEGSINGGDFVAINGIAINGTAIVSSTTANGIFRFNVASLIKVQVRFSTATTGNPAIMLIASSESSNIISNTLTLPAITGAVTTTDSVLPSSITTQAAPAKIIPVAPTLPTSGINNFLASYFPQIFQRLRVESAGSNKTPFKQEDNTDKLTVGNEEERVLLQNILRQLEISNIFKYQQLERNGHPNLRIPDGFNEF